MPPPSTAPPPAVSASSGTGGGSLGIGGYKRVLGISSVSLRPAELLLENYREGVGLVIPTSSAQAVLYIT